MCMLPQSAFSWQLVAQRDRVKNPNYVKVKEISVLRGRTA